MINIAICDNEAEQVAYIRQLVDKWVKNESQTARISGFESAEAFLFAYEEDKATDILLLDIQMNGKTGMELARKLRRDNERVQIIFITGYSDFMADGYDVQALHYLIKPVKEEKFFAVLNMAAERIKTEPRVITFPKPGGAVKIKAEDIIYVEIQSHTCVLQLKTGSESFRMRLNDMEKLLGEGFFKCHRSYIVNMKYVNRVTRSCMMLVNGQEIPLSRGLYDGANQAFIEYN